MTEPITPRQFHEADGLEDWRVVEGASACFRTGSLSLGGRLVQAIAGLEGLADHHACVDLRNESVSVRLYTYAPAPDGLSTCDIELARQISALARDLGIAADPTAIQNLVVSVDAMVIADVLPFWRAVLGYEPRPDTPDDELNDPRERMPVFYFNQMGHPRPQRNRIHIDVWVPPDQAEARVGAALAAGGTLVTDEHAPGWWVLADAEGNEACVSTWKGTG
ncbi:MAG TPA: VOC family protein [Nocardioidaceae bacterium]|nr:VOC family protein [Nocardioidaceae bacterium]